MTVRELIEELGEFDGDLPVVSYDQEGIADLVFEVDLVEVIEGRILGNHPLVTKRCVVLW